MTSASSCVGCHSSVSPFQTGTPANSANFSTRRGRSREIRCRRTFDRARARCPSRTPCGPTASRLDPCRSRGRPGRGRPTSKADRVLVEVFSKISAIFCPSAASSQCPSTSPGAGDPPVDQGQELLLREVRVLQQASPLEVLQVLLLAHYAGSLSIGHVMHRGPPRPRPSSLPSMVMT